MQQLRGAGATNALVQGFLGMLLVQGDGIAVDLAEGLRLLRGSAAKGCLPAMNELGYINLEGHYGVPADRTEALKWIRSAAAHGWANAQCNLGYCYERGLGIEPDAVQAATWYERAAQQTNLVAIGSLGVFYMNGRGGLPRDYPLAERFLKQAMDGGNIRAKLNLGCLYVDNGYRTNLFEHGIQLIREAAEAGDFRAQARQAGLYFYGKGVPKDLTNYVVWTRKAAEQGLAEAQFDLANALGAGRFVQLNLDRKSVV